MNNTLYLVDAFAHIYRGFHAISDLSTSSGRPSNAIFAMGKFLLGIEKDLKPEFGAFVFDKGIPGERISVIPEYKANRPPMPDNLKKQIETIKKMIAAFGWNIAEKEGFEADDVIATIATKFPEERVEIISNDKDISQIIDDRVTMLVTLPGEKGFKIRDRKAVMEKFEVKPEQIIDYLSLIGDASDNIRGVPGIGPKTAVKLLSEYGNIQNMLNSLESIDNEKLRQKLKDSSELLLRNESIIALNRELELNKPKNKEDLAINSPDLNVLISIAEEYELKSLLTEFKKLPIKEHIQTEFLFTDL